MRKHKKARLLTMDELHARPCEVDGRPALFHRWVEEDRALLRFETMIHHDERKYVEYRFHEAGVIPPGCSTEVIRETFALVEYRDGTIAKVSPELIRFVDKEGQSREP